MTATTAKPPKPKSRIAPGLRPLAVDLDKLKPSARNARVHDQRSIDAIAQSLARYGQQKPIVVAPDGSIIAGEGQYRAATQLGWTQIAAVKTDLRGTEATAYAIADNRTADLSTWNKETLTELLAELRTEDEALLLAAGFTDEELKSILDPTAPPPGIDDIPEPPDKPTTKRGQLWILGEHRLLCGDSAEQADVDRLLEGGKVELLNTDPPYNVKVEPRSNNAIAAGLSSFPATNAVASADGNGRHHQGFDLARHKTKSTPTHKKLRPKDRPLENDFVSDEAFEGMLRAWFGHVGRVLAPGRAFYIWGGYANCGNYPPALRASALYFAQAIIWVKAHPVLTRKDFMGNHEWCFYGWREGGAHYFAPGLHNVPDVWEVGPQPGEPGTPHDLGEAGAVFESPDGGRVRITAAPPKSKPTAKLAAGQTALVRGPGPTDVWRVKKIPPQKMVHLTEKPVELAMRAMHYSSRRGETVLDLFGGSGSTLMAAQACERRARLMELDPAYCDVIVERWQTFTGLKAKRG